MNMNDKYQTLEKFIEYIEKPDSDYPWVVKDLPEKPTALEKCKFEICQGIITYKQRNKLAIEELAKKVQLDLDPAVESHREELQKDLIKKILFCWIDYFSLEELIDYASGLSLSVELKISPNSKPNITSDNYQGEWDDSLNDPKILEIIQARLNNNNFEPLPEPHLLWDKEIFYVETTYRGKKYRLIFWLEDRKIHLRNIWLVN